MDTNRLLKSRRGAIKISLFLSILLMGACSTETSDDSRQKNSKLDDNDDFDGKKVTITAHDILVERSAPLLNAIVIDSTGKIAIERDNGIYRFKELPQMPVYLFSGLVNFNLNKNISLSDLKNSFMLGCSEGGLITILTSICAHDEKKEWLKNSFNLSDEHIYKTVPRFDKKIAAICDELYRYSIEVKQSKPSKITLEELENLKPLISKRIEDYKRSEKSPQELEIDLSTQLNQDFVTQSDIDNYKNGSTNPKIVIDQLPKGQLDEDTRYSLAFMWNEERLAGDAYMAFYTTHYPNLNDKEKKIADKVLKTIWYSERLHQETVEALIKKYDIDILHIDDYDRKYSYDELKSMELGKYPIKKLQALWDNVAPIGLKDLTSALKIGCIAEIGDIEDLDRYIDGIVDAVDVRYVYEFLRAGSILHYWAFDKALKELGVEDGSCSISSRYCKRKGDFEISGDGGTQMSLLDWVEEN